MIKRISYSQAPYFDLHTTTNASKFWAAFKGRLTVTVLLVESIIAYHWLSLHFMLNQFICKWFVYQPKKNEPLRIWQARGDLAKSDSH